jgi:hypothetical protein
LARLCHLLSGTYCRNHFILEQIMKAFPTHSISVSDEARVTAIGGEGGMDLRDYFAAKVMQGFCADPDFSYRWDSSEQLAKRVYVIADEGFMMEVRQE